MLPEQIGARQLRVVVQIHHARHLQRRRARRQAFDRAHRGEALGDPPLLHEHRAGEVGDVGGLSPAFRRGCQHFGHAPELTAAQQRRREQHARFGLRRMRPQHALGGFDRLVDASELERQLGDREPPADALRSALNGRAVELERCLGSVRTRAPARAASASGSSSAGARAALTPQRIALLAGRESLAAPAQRRRGR